MPEFENWIVNLTAYIDYADVTSEDIDDDIIKELKRFGRWNKERIMGNPDYAKWGDPEFRVSVTTDDTIVYVFYYEKDLYKKVMKGWGVGVGKGDYIESLECDKQELEKQLKTINEMIVEAETDEDLQMAWR